MCFDCDWENVSKHIVEMRKDSEKYGFADDYLFSVLEQMKLKHHITPKQKQAVRNIYRGANKPKPKEWDRRYEGHEQDRR